MLQINLLEENENMIIDQNCHAWKLEPSQSGHQCESCLKICVEKKN